MKRKKDIINILTWTRWKTRICSTHLAILNSKKKEESSFLWWWWQKRSQHSHTPTHRSKHRKEQTVRNLKNNSQMKKTEYDEECMSNAICTNMTIICFLKRVKKMNKKKKRNKLDRSKIDCNQPLYTSFKMKINSKNDS